MTNYSITVSDIKNDRVRRAVICVTLPLAVVAQIIIVVVGCLGMAIAILVAIVCTKHGSRTGSAYLRRSLLWLYEGFELDRLVESAKRIW